MKKKQGKSVIGLFLKINPTSAILMKRSRREPSIDMVILVRGVFKNNQITLFPCFSIIPETGVSFYSDDVKKNCLDRRIGGNSLSHTVRF